MKADELIHQLILGSITISQALQLSRIEFSKELAEESLNWINNECEGYSNPLELPNYRMPDCVVKVRMQMPFVGVKDELLDLTVINKWLMDAGQGNASPKIMRISQDIESLEKISNTKSNKLLAVLPKEMADMILRCFSYPSDIVIERIYQECSIESIRIIFSEVKNRLINILQTEVVASHMNGINEIPSASSDKDKKTIFISYGWEDCEHKKWVYKLANDLSSFFNVKIDVKTPFGAELNTFMEKMVSNSDRVLIIVTPTYKMKADNRENGVGYESVLISDEIFNNQATIKFIPIIRKGSKKESYPKYLGNRKGVVMTDDNLYEDMLQELVEDIKEN